MRLSSPGPSAHFHPVMSSFPNLRGRRVPRAAAACFALLIVLGPSGCAARSGETWAAGDAERSETVRLTLTNQTFSDARIYARWNGERRRLGIVTGNRSETFTLDWRPGATLRIEVDFVAGGSFVSEGITGWPGDSWEFIIPSRVRE
jgi:hypothetical protein